MQFRDYEEFIAALNGRNVRYLIVGAHAVALHARPRATKDLDILIEPSPINARRIVDALRDFFGGKDAGYSVEDLLDPGSTIQIGVAPIRVDILSDLPPWSPAFRTLWRSRVDAQFGSVKAHYLGLDDLVQTKEATGRPQDVADLVSLQRARQARRDRRGRSKPGRPKK